IFPVLTTVIMRLHLNSGSVLNVVLMSPSEIVEGSSVTLTCSTDANPAANYTWYKENEESPKASGQIFTITDIRAEHSGNYYCVVQDTTSHYNSTLHLIVVGGKFFTLLLTDTHVGFFYSSSKYLKSPLLITEKNFLLPGCVFFPCWFIAKPVALIILCT
uniref:Ig-like domain-containing protein n=1 Tax=Anabas testudineus TaxID=64144 RepID=A0A3Q1H275_ANATE